MQRAGVPGVCIQFNGTIKTNETGPKFLSGDTHLYAQNGGFVIDRIPNPHGSEAFCDWTLEVSLKSILTVRTLACPPAPARPHNDRAAGSHGRTRTGSYF